jgi:hypothetical protein
MHEAVASLRLLCNQPTLIWPLPAAGGVDPFSNPHSAAERAAAEARNQHKLCIPRRPAWDASTTHEQLEAQEKQSFLDWRRWGSRVAARGGWGGSGGLGRSWGLSRYRHALLPVASSQYWVAVVVDCLVAQVERQVVLTVTVLM